MTKPLLMHHELLLLSLCNQTGRFQSVLVPHAVAAGLLSELTLTHRIKLECGKNPKVVSISTKSLGDPLADEISKLIANSKKPKTLAEWLCHIAGMKELTHRIAKSLCSRNILRIQEERYFLGFSHKLYPEVHGKTERGIRNRMSKLMFGQTAAHDERTTVLVSLANTFQLLPLNFDKSRLARNKQRIKRVANGELFSARAPRSSADRMKQMLKINCSIATATSG